jgi:hypothetical protein
MAPPLPDGHPFPLLSLLCLATFHRHQSPSSVPLGARAAYAHTLAHVLDVGEAALNVVEVVEVEGQQEQAAAGVRTAAEEAGLCPGLWATGDNGAASATGDATAPAPVPAALLPRPPSPIPIAGAAGPGRGGGGSKGVLEDEDLVRRARALAAKLLPGLLPPPPPQPTTTSTTTTTTTTSGMWGERDPTTATLPPPSPPPAPALLAHKLASALHASREDLGILWALLHAGVGGGATTTATTTAASAASTAAAAPSSAFNFARSSAAASASVQGEAAAAEDDPFKAAVLLALRMRAALVEQLCPPSPAQQQEQQAAKQLRPAFSDPFALSKDEEGDANSSPSSGVTPYLPLCPEAVPLALLAPGNADLVAAVLPTGAAGGVVATVRACGRVGVGVFFCFVCPPNRTTTTTRTQHHRPHSPSPNPLPQQNQTNHNTQAASTGTMREWAQIRDLHLPLWCRSLAPLRRLAEEAAAHAFRRSQDPMKVSE